MNDTQYAYYQGQYQPDQWSTDFSAQSAQQLTTRMPSTFPPHFSQREAAEAGQNAPYLQSPQTTNSAFASTLLAPSSPVSASSSDAMISSALYSNASTGLTVPTPTTSPSSHEVNVSENSQQIRMQLHQHAVAEAARRSNKRLRSDSSAAAIRDSEDFHAQQIPPNPAFTGQSNPSSSPTPCHLQLQNGKQPFQTMQPQTHPNLHPEHGYPYAAPNHERPTRTNDPLLAAASRSNRLDSERRRRETIRDNMEDLRAVLPDELVAKATKSKLLATAVQYIQNLRSENEDLQRRCEALDAHNRMLSSQLSDHDGNARVLAQPVPHHPLTMAALQELSAH